MANAAKRQSADGKRSPFRLGLFDKPEDLARAEEIWNKSDSELTDAERRWMDGVMNLILRTQSPRGRKADAEYQRIERLFVRLALAGKPRPSYGQIAELLPPQIIELSRSMIGFWRSMVVLPESGTQDSFSPLLRALSNSLRTVRLLTP